MARVLWTLLLLVLLIGSALWVSGLIPHCCGAREEPGKVEAVLARNLRSLSLPSEARQRKNPFTSSPELLRESARHFADHCASCHGNDGIGNTDIGRNLYPRTPDMRQSATQQLSDGELYYVIHNGVRWTGMPAWGEGGPDDHQSWHLVLFIRHLPKLTAEEIAEMEELNPKSPEEWQQMQAEESFLGKGQSPAPAAAEHQTHHP